MEETPSGPDGRSPPSSRTARPDSGRRERRPRTVAGRCLRPLRDNVVLLAVLLVAVVARAYLYADVFRPEGVVLLANDPHYYRFVVESHVAAADGPLELLSPAVRDPLFVVVLSLAVVLAGGPATGGVVLAWYPVVVGTLTVALVALLATRLTDSRPVGVVAATLLALSPVHVARTSLGFADHHAWDYLLLVAGALLLLELLRAPVDRRRGPLAGLAVVLAAQVLSWVAGILLVVPAAGVVLLVALRDAAERDRPVRLGGAVAFLPALGLVVAAHLAVGWLDPAVVAGFAALVALVGLAVSSLRVAATVALPWRPTLGVVTTVTFLAALGVSRLPAVRDLVTGAAGYAGAPVNAGIAETVSLVGGPWGPLTGPLSQFGLELFLAAPALVWVTAVAARRRGTRPLLLATFGWSLLALALAQRRFAGELSPFVAVLAAVTLVEVLVRGGLVPELPSPTRLGLSSGTPRRDTAPHGRVHSDRPGGYAAGVGRRVLPLLAVLLVVSTAVTGSGLVAVKHNQAGVDPATTEVARVIGAYADAHDLAPEDRYVLSPMNENRLFNYGAGGNLVAGPSFVYARVHYRAFVAGADPDGNYRRYADRVGFVVTTDRDAPEGPDDPGASAATTYATLHGRLGSAGEDAPGAGHYRLVGRSSDGSVAAFALVPGATLVGRAVPDTTVPVRLPVSAGDHSYSFVYTREVVATHHGWFALTVPYPGSYDVAGSPVVVTEADVAGGRVVGDVPVDRSRGHWTFDEGRGDVVFDAIGGHHGHRTGGSWLPADAATGTDGGLAVDGSGSALLPAPLAPTGETGLSLAVRVTDVAAVGSGASADRRFARLVAAAPAGRYSDTRGFQVGLADGRVVGAVGDGPGAAVVYGPRIDDGGPHEVHLHWDGAVVTLTVDGQQVAETAYRGPVSAVDPVVVGGAPGGRYGFDGVVTDVRLGPG